MIFTNYSMFGTSQCIEEQSGCKRCRDGICARCAVLLHQGNCVNTCPPGHIADWSTKDEYMGRICKETKYLFGFTGSQIAILVGIVSGAVICILIILCGAVIIHRRKKKATKLIQRFENSIERKEFLKHLAALRREGNTFLSMLNDTRRQVRELYYSRNNGDSAVGIQAYRPVLRDLARILVLINRKDDIILIPPDDWQRLFSWAHRLLKQYKMHSSEVTQLTTFLQQPRVSVQLTSSPQVALSQSSQPYERRNTPTSLTTFQANTPLSTFQASDKSSISPVSSSLGYIKDSPINSSLGQNSSGIYNEKLSPNGSTVGQNTPLVYNNQDQIKELQELAISTFNHTYNTGTTLTESTCAVDEYEANELNHELNLHWEFQSTAEATNYTILPDWSSVHEYFIDDFTILGFRPQDEITTEL